MIKDELLKAAMMELIGYSLEWRKILNHLIKPATYALSILGNKARNAARSNDANHQNNTIKNPAQEMHEHLTKKLKYRRKRGKV